MTQNELIDERVPYERRVFCNRNLRLDSIRFVGFDMDYTLALYHEKMEHLQADMAIHRLVHDRGYPRACLKTRHEPGFAIRGLAVDRPHGNILKMDAHRFVGKVWHGAAPLDKQLRRDLYSNRKVSPGLEAITMVDTLFSLPEISLYSQLVAQLDAEVADPDYNALWEDLRYVMDSVHRDGSLKSEIMKDVPSYVIKDPDLPETLHRFRSAGKKLFIATNSEPHYTEAVMSWLLDGGHVAYQSWRDYFDVILCDARKPGFFAKGQPFVECLADGSVVGEETEHLKRGAFYSGGNVRDFERMMGMAGEDVLYVGDHIYGDILRSKSHTHWRTALVIQELERELETIRSEASGLRRLEALEAERAAVNLEIAARALDGTREKHLVGRARSLSQQVATLEQQLSSAFNANWGMLFRDRAELSAFGAQVENYACVYTSRVTNFGRYSPLWYFRSPRDWMAHELHL